MKDNLNIEKLFKEKFDSFEGEVNPNAWTNIQQGMNVGGATVQTGMSLLMKTAIISGGIIVATVVGVYLFSDSNPIADSESSIVAVDEVKKEVGMDESKEALPVVTMVDTESTIES